MITTPTDLNILINLSITNWGDRHFTKKTLPKLQIKNKKNHICYSLAYQMNKRPPSSVPIRASESPSTGARAPTQTPGDARGWELGVLRERWDYVISEQCYNNWMRENITPALCYLSLSDSINTCRVEPWEAEWEEVTTLDLDTPTTAWTSPSQSDSCERLEHDSSLCTRTTHTLIYPLGFILVHTISHKVSATYQKVWCSVLYSPHFSDF